jgi:predicted small lipoprotein YifL
MTIPPGCPRGDALLLRFLRAPVLVAAALALAACGADGPPERPGADPDTAASASTDAEASPAELFLANLASQCGSAFSGGLTLEPPGDDMLTGTEELIVHFRDCGADTLRIPFHIEIEDAGTWDRSRTWMLMRAPGGGLELRHDHREPDGSHSATTMYGGFTETPGTAERQDFVSVQRTEESGYARGWRIEIVPGERYTYGTTRQGEWSWRIDFDLTQAVPPPPAPWGHD